MILAVDTETTGLDVWHGCRPFLVIATDSIHQWHWWGQVNPFNRAEVIWEEKDLEEIQNLLFEADKLVFHNSKFDLHMLEAIGLFVDFWDKIDDTMIQSHLICSGEKHGLKPLAYKYLDIPETDERELIDATERVRNSNNGWDKAKKGHPCLPGQKKDFVHCDYWMAPEECLKYGFGDVHRTYLLNDVFTKYFKDKKLESVYEQRRQSIEPIYKMECNGYNCYVDMLEQDITEKKKQKEEQRRLIQWESKFPRYFDPGKKEHVKRMFEINLKLDSPLSTPSGANSYNKEAIALLISQNPDVPALQAYAEHNKIQTKIQYLQGYHTWNVDGVIHPNYWITGTRETRLSCERPNLQNIDRTSRHYFGPPQGYYWIDMDLENIEMAIWIYEVGNYELINLFESGKSVHLFISNLIPQRKKIIDEVGEAAFKKMPEYNYVKNGNFSIIYGATEKKADETYRVNGAYRIVANRFPEVPEQTQRTIDEVLENHETYGKPFVTTLGGYQLDVSLEDIFKACNYKIQGSAGFIMTRGMNRVYKSREFSKQGGKMRNQVHDSLVIQQKIGNTNHKDHEELAKIYCDHLTNEPLLKTCRASYEIKYHPSEVPF